MPVALRSAAPDLTSLHEVDLATCRIALLARTSASPFDRYGLQSFLEAAQHDDCSFPESRTRVIAGKTQVVKIRHRRAAFQDAWLTLQAYRQNEKICRLHHPFKTWFILHCPERKPGQNSDWPWLVGNIAPRLTCLADLFTQTSSISPQHRCGLLRETLRMYLLNGFRHRSSADLSLENFAVDPHGRIYYLDDEFYPADPLPALIDFLAGLLRRYEWMEETLIFRLADFLAELLIRQPGGRRRLTELTCGLRSRFMAGPKRPLLHLLCHRLGMANQTVPDSSPVPNSDSDWGRMAAPPETGNR